MNKADLIKALEPYLDDIETGIASVEYCSQDEGIGFLVIKTKKLLIAEQRLKMVQDTFQKKTPFLSFSDDEFRKMALDCSLPCDEDLI